MVYCTKCGTKSEEDAKHCSKCGANIGGSLEEQFERRAEKWGECFGKDAEDCFGLPHGGVIASVIFGIIIIVVGLSLIPGLIPTEFREATEPIFWPIIILVVGILIVAGAIYKLTRNQ